MKTISKFNLGPTTDEHRDEVLRRGTIILVSYLNDDERIYPVLLQSVAGGKIVLADLGDPGCHWGPPLESSECTLNKIQEQIGFQTCELAPIGFSITLEVKN